VDLPPLAWRRIPAPGPWGPAGSVLKRYVARLNHSCRVTPAAPSRDRKHSSVSCVASHPHGSSSELDDLIRRMRALDRPGR
jgi:hypothetical protein